MKIIKGDKIKVTNGKDKGRSGEVLKTFPADQTIVVKGVNIFKKHIKSQNGQKGGIVEKERPLNVSQTVLLCPNCQKPTKVGYQVDKTGQKTRLCKKCHQPIIQKVK